LPDRRLQRAVAERDLVRIDKLAVIGAGTMGHGIAQVFAQAGLQVALTDSNAKVRGSALARIEGNLDACLGRSVTDRDGALAVLERITVTPDLDEAVSAVDLVFEAVFEDLELKRQVLREIEAHCAPQVILISSTSGYRVRDLAVALDHPERFLALHFWNPPYIVPVVEVMPGAHTLPEVVDATFALLQKAGKVPALVRKDVPGYVGNRLQHALRREAIALVAEGVASPEDVDTITRLSFGLRMPVVGPLETVDLAGLDLTQAIQTYLLPDLDRSTAPKQLVRDKVGRGELGVKTGEGFYEWPPGRAARVIRRRDEALLEMVEWLRGHDLLGAPSGQAEAPVEEPRHNE
jgi:3-hydroxybutyryl-CoA dehydrogenase